MKTGMRTPHRKIVLTSFVRFISLLIYHASVLEALCTAYKECWDLQSYRGYDEVF